MKDLADKKGLNFFTTPDYLRHSHPSQNYHGYLQQQRFSNYITRGVNKI